MRAEDLLRCALTYRAAPTRTSPVGDRFESVDDALQMWHAVLLHEAHESMRTPLETPPEQPLLHPVDVETDEPGIVDRDAVRRFRPPLPLVEYHPQQARPTSTSTVFEPAPVVTRPAHDAHLLASKALQKEVARAERGSAASERREERAAERKRARENETPDQRETRLAEARRKREDAKRRKEQQQQPPQQQEQQPPQKKPARVPAASEDALLHPDTSLVAVGKLPKRRASKKTAYYAHPLPHHRHLDALCVAAPHDALRPALLRGEPCTALQLVQGPPGTGKTRQLVSRLRGLPAGARALLCAPTNVGAANLYSRCLADGWGDQCSLALAPERVPPGTPVQSNDPSKRIVCATISARAGMALDAQRFDAVLVDEAAQCMEAWVWTLLRPEVQFVALAGDVHQLPAQTSESGRTLRHERSLMERLLALGYPHQTLVEQNRMAPELLAFPNACFYGDLLVQGSHAPEAGHVEMVVVADGAEEANGTSTHNRAEAIACAAAAAGADDDKGGGDKAPSSVVLIAPYAAQCRLLQAQKTGCEVHTVDSFQGRESECVVLSVVRDGTRGLGFWSDARRLAVALTRAKRKLIVVVSASLVAVASASDPDAPLCRWIRTHAPTP